jgi:hypothetical protein
MHNEDGSVSNTGQQAMNKPSRAKGILTDFAASLAMALTIGVATSVTLAGAVVLIAHGSSQPTAQSTAEEVASAS